MLLWQMHMCYSEMRSPSLEYVKVLFKVRAMFIFSLEAFFWKIIMLFWKGKNFMICFCEINTCVTLKRSPSLEYVTVMFKVREVFIFSLKVLLCKILTLFLKGKSFTKCFCEKHICFTLIWEAPFSDVSMNCSTLEQCSFSL